MELNLMIVAAMAILIGGGCLIFQVTEKCENLSDRRRRKIEEEVWGSV